MRPSYSVEAERDLGGLPVDEDDLLARDAAAGHTRLQHIVARGEDLRTMSIEAYRILPHNFGQKGYRVNFVNPRGLGFSVQPGGSVRATSSLCQGVGFRSPEAAATAVLASETPVKASPVIRML